MLGQRCAEPESFQANSHLKDFRLKLISKLWKARAKAIFDQRINEETSRMERREKLEWAFLIILIIIDIINAGHGKVLYV